jgi:nucleoid-associated protein YgaU
MSGTDPTLLPAPELQFVDSNGAPYAGGTLALYAPGTTTPKASWTDWQGTALNTNPIVLDAAGRCIVWGDGDYRCVLSDAQGNLIFDQNSTTLVSAAMVPVVSAPDLATARRLMGIDDAIAVETNRALAAEQALQTEIDAKADKAYVDAETARAEAAEAALQAALDAEIARAKAAEAALGAAVAPIMQAGIGTSDASGTGSVTFPTPFVHSVTAVVATALGRSWWVNVPSMSNTGFSVTTSSPLAGGSWAGGPMAFNWVAIGN